MIPRPILRQLPEGAPSWPGPHDDLRGECRERGIDLDHVTDHALGYVLAAVEGDVQLAADALEMNPRAPWVEEFAGVHGRGL